MLLPSLPVMFRKRQLAIRWNRHDAYFQKLGALEMNPAFCPGATALLRSARSLNF
jgi:hypothetical protein